MGVLVNGSTGLVESATKRSTSHYPRWDREGAFVTQNFWLKERKKEGRKTKGEERRWKSLEKLCQDFIHAKMNRD